MSLSEKTIKWLADIGAPDMNGKTVLITGANSGVGFKTAEIMLSLGAKVIMACRSQKRAEAARAVLLRDHPDAEITVTVLDMADFSSIDAFVARLSEHKTDIDVFINNAGVFRKPDMKTADGFELVIGTNYIGVYYLSEKVLPYLAELSHKVYYINTVSMIHKIARVDYEDFYYAERYGDIRAYARSKLCLAKYTYALAKRYEDSGISAMMTHPGIAITPLGINAYGGVVRRLAPMLSWAFNSPEKSALSAAYILSRDLPRGSIVGPDKLFGGWGYPKLNRVMKKVMTGADELISFTQSEIEKHTDKRRFTTLWDRHGK